MKLINNLKSFFTFNQSYNKANKSIFELKNVPAGKEQINKIKISQNLVKVHQTNLHNLPSFISKDKQEFKLKNLQYNLSRAYTIKATNDITLAKLLCITDSKVNKNDILVLHNDEFRLLDSSEIKENKTLEAAAHKAVTFLMNKKEFKEYFRQTTFITADDILKTTNKVYKEKVAPTYESLGQSLNSNVTVSRMPTEVTIDWISTLEKELLYLSNKDIKKTLSELMLKQKNRWLNHNLTVEETRKSFTEDAKILKKIGLNSLSKMVENLNQQLPKNTADIPLTQLQDNIYGRAFESLWISHLVQDPPKKMLMTMQQFGKSLHEMISNLEEKDRKQCITNLQNLIRSNERFWFREVEHITDFLQQSWPESETKLKNLLCTPINNGEKAILMPYLSVKIYLSMGNIQKYSQLISNVNANYSNIGNHTGRIINSTIKYNYQSLNSAPGISLVYQPPAVKIDQLVSDDRPALRNTFNNNQTPLQTSNMLKNGVPYVSGVSGSTNIILGLIDFFNKEGKNIDVTLVQLATNMFLTYDGGHSIHESLWVNSQRETEGMPLTSENKKFDPEAFISNYEVFKNTYNGETLEKVDKALDKAWVGTTNYFRENSSFFAESTKL